MTGRLYKNRKDLSWHPAFSHLTVDTDGRPCVWLNHYEAQHKDGTMQEWCSAWSCQCEDDGVEPVESEWIGPEDKHLIDLWESLPED